MRRLQRASTLIESLAENLGLGDSIRLERIKNRWEQLIGPPISLHTQPVYFKNATLTVHVESNLWFTELRYHKEHKENIITKLGEFGVVSVRFKQGDVVWPKQPPPPAPDVLLSAGEVAYIESLTQDIKDAELREALRRAALKSFARLAVSNRTP
ncbi:MAG: DUF721 domain-containing protein [Nitrospirae bacterium]|nr:DUF721 domain-containing protein [Nitrospirota bacterium]